MLRLMHIDEGQYCQLLAEDVQNYCRQVGATSDCSLDGECGCGLFTHLHVPERVHKVGCRKQQGRRLAQVLT